MTPRTTIQLGQLAHRAEDFIDAIAQGLARPRPVPVPIRRPVEHQTRQT